MVPQKYQMPTRKFIVGLSPQAIETINWFIEQRGATNNSAALDLVCWVARKVLCDPELAERVLADLPTLPEAISLIRVAQNGTSSSQSIPSSREGSAARPADAADDWGLDD